jgi:tRNA C32,U32 (ribose-2'-O)-methylase TrmJ
MERESFANERASLLRQLEDCTKAIERIQQAYKTETERMHQHMLDCQGRTQKALTEADMLRGQVATIAAQVATRPTIIVESGRVLDEPRTPEQPGS